MLTPFNVQSVCTDWDRCWIGCRGIGGCWIGCWIGGWIGGDGCRVIDGCRGIDCSGGFLDLDLLGLVGDFEALCVFFLVIAVTAVARWLLRLFIFLSGEGDWSLSDLILDGDGDGDFFCLFTLAEDFAGLRLLVLDGLLLLLLVLEGLLLLLCGLETFFSEICFFEMILLLLLLAILLATALDSAIVGYRAVIGSMMPLILVQTVPPLPSVESSALVLFLVLSRIVVLAPTFLVAHAVRIPACRS